MEWTVIRVSKETKDILDELKDNTSKKLNKDNLFNKEYNIKISYDMVIQRLLRHWKRF